MFLFPQLTPPQPHSPTPFCLSSVSSNEWKLWGTFNSCGDCHLLYPDTAISPCFFLPFKNSFLSSQEQMTSPCIAFVLFCFPSRRYTSYRTAKVHWLPECQPLPRHQSQSPIPPLHPFRSSLWEPSWRKYWPSKLWIQCHSGNQTNNPWIQVGANQSIRLPVLSARKWSWKGHGEWEEEWIGWLSHVPSLISCCL